MLESSSHCSSKEDPFASYHYLLKDSTIQLLRNKFIPDINEYKEPSFVSYDPSSETKTFMITKHTDEINDEGEIIACDSESFEQSVSFKSFLSSMLLTEINKSYRLFCSKMIDLRTNEYAAASFIKDILNELVFLNRMFHETEYFIKYEIEFPHFQKMNLHIHKRYSLLTSSSIDMNFPVLNIVSAPITKPQSHPNTFIWNKDPQDLIKLHSLLVTENLIKSDIDIFTEAFSGYFNKQTKIIWLPQKNHQGKMVLEKQSLLHFLWSMHQNKFILIKILNGQNLEEVTNVNIQNRLFKKFIPNIFCG